MLGESSGLIVLKKRKKKVIAQYDHSTTVLLDSIK